MLRSVDLPRGLISEFKNGIRSHLFVDVNEVWNVGDILAQTIRRETSTGDTEYVLLHIVVGIQPLEHYQILLLSDVGEYSLDYLSTVTWDEILTSGYQPTVNAFSLRLFELIVEKPEGFVTLEPLIKLFLEVKLTKYLLQDLNFICMHIYRSNELGGSFIDNNLLILLEDKINAKLVMQFNKEFRDTGSEDMTQLYIQLFGHDDPLEFIPYKEIEGALWNLKYLSPSNKTWTALRAFNKNKLFAETQCLRTIQLKVAVDAWLVDNLHYYKPFAAYEKLFESYKDKADEVKA